MTWEEGRLSKMDVPETVNKYLGEGRRREQQGQLEEALSLYDRAAELDNTLWPVRSCQVRALYQLDRISDAEQLLDDYLQSVDASHSAVLNDRGVIKAEQGDAEGAIECFSSALQSPRSLSAPLILGNLAYMLYTEKRMDECVKHCDKTLQLDPDETRVHYLLSVAEATRFLARARLASEIVREGAPLHVFTALRFHGQSMRKYDARIVDEEDPHVHILESAELTRPGTHWGVLVPHREELWCTFARQVARGQIDVDSLMALPTEYRLVQRRRWVRVSATGALAKLKVRSFPEGVKPFEIMELFELNLSAGGAAVRTVPELPPQTEVTLFLGMSEKEEIEVNARVVRIGEPGQADPYLALVYLGLEEKHREKIARFVHEVQLKRKRHPWDKIGNR